MNRYWSDLVRGLAPYEPGEQPGEGTLVKLNTNENPYPPSAEVVRAIAAVGADRLRLYPDPESSRLCNAIAERYGLEPSQVFVGNGSDEVLAFTFMALLKHELPLCFPDVSYSFYPVWSQLCGIECREIAVAEDFTIDPALYPTDNGGIILPNPNAPTGLLLELDVLRELLQQHADSVVVVDEAYIDFGGRSAVELIRDFDNLLVVQTLSKSRALAGLRVGMAMGSQGLIEALHRIKNSFNSYPVDVVAEEAALAALRDDTWFEDTRRRIIASRERLRAGLLELDFDVLPSQANFLFAMHPHHQAVELFDALRERNILVRHFRKPRFENFLRISVGTDAECDALLAALRDLLAAMDR
ncbi:MAG: histidinol-phosphate transaminase [Halioglobus sp.]|nr:histidinol-phosphate transaminase [Halioglobus sp.]